MVKDKNKKAALKIAAGYRTESGRGLREAAAEEFIIKPDGGLDFGYITPEIEAATGGELKAGAIRLRVGSEKEGLVHAKRHEEEYTLKGFPNAESFIADISQNFTRITRREGRDRPSYTLIKFGDSGKNNGGVESIAFRRAEGGDGSYYIVVTAYNRRDKGMRKIKEPLVYGRPPLDSATPSGAEPVPARAGGKAGASTERPATSDRQAVLNSSISYDQPKVKE